MTLLTESNREQAIKLAQSGMSVKDISATLGVSRVSVYGYLKNQEPKQAGATSMPATDSLELELLRIENQSLYAQLALYKRECARLTGLLED